MAEERQIFTLKQVATSIQRIISERYQQAYWLQTEIHKLNYTSKGHCYPELVHKENGRIVAEMRGTIWATSFDKISKNFAQVVKEPLRDGMSLLMLVKIVFHPLYGMSLEIIDIDPTYSLGELQKERDETLKRLTKEGVLNNNQKLIFPLLPKRIAVISMDSSKGLMDFYSVTQNNPWNYNFFFMLFPAQLNGDLAVDSIVNQLNKIEKVKHHFDIVLIIRGGGGEIGLSCYNNYSLAKKIATFPLPIMTGIGHSTNITVSEMVAFRSAITPTELADFLIQAFHEFSVPLENAKKSIGLKVLNLLDNKRVELKNEMRFLSKNSTIYLVSTKNHLKNEMRSIQHKTVQYLQSFYLKTTQLNFVITHSTKNIFHLHRSKLASTKSDLQTHFSNEISEHEKKISRFSDSIIKASKIHLEKNQNQLKNIENSLRLVDPAEVLKRGYSLTLKDGKLISAKNPIKVGDKIETQTKDKIITSEVLTEKRL
ncbi:MAG: exodeoxyribonuclease VII large subunit [Bacteroidota bacterium]